MQSFHLHLLVNHLPVFALFFGLLATIWFFFSRARAPLVILVGLFVTGAVASVIASQTGQALHLRQSAAGMDEATIRAHAETAESAQVAAIALSIFSLALSLVSQREPKWLGIAILGMCLFAVFTNFLMIRTAFLGGEIRPTEIHDTTE